MRFIAYAQGVGAKMFLPREPLATHGTGEGPLSSVTAKVPLHNSLLLGRVRAEGTLMQFDWNQQAVTCGMEEAVKKNLLGRYQVHKLH